MRIKLNRAVDSLCAFIFLVNILTACGHAPVPIKTTMDTDIFPKTWVAPPISAASTQLEKSEEERSLRILRAGLTKYPEKLLRDNLKRIYVLGSLTFSGIFAAGTNSKNNIYIVNQGPSKGYSDIFFEGILHHELSSILLRNHTSALNTTLWMQQLPHNFHYGQSGSDAVLNKKANLKPSLRELRQGFLNQYSRASLEEDLNCIAENLFVGGKKFWQFVDEHEHLRGKVKLVIEFYNRLSPIFTEEYFKSLVAPKQK